MIAGIEIQAKGPKCKSKCLAKERCAIDALTQIFQVQHI